MAQPKQTIRVLMADDHVIFRDGFATNICRAAPRWSLQNRPTVVSAKPANGMAQDLVLLSRFLLIGQACFGPPAPRPTFKDMAVVEKAVEHSGDRGAVAKQFAPVFHRAVGS